MCATSAATPFTTTLLLRYQGRKSRRTMITPLIYGDIGGEIVIVASKGGADHHPAWYINIRDVPEVDIQIATQAFRARKREPEGNERAKVWASSPARRPIGGQCYHVTKIADCWRTGLLTIVWPGNEDAGRTPDNHGLRADQNAGCEGCEHPRAAREVPA